MANSYVGISWNTCPSAKPLDSFPTFWGHFNDGNARPRVKEKQSWSVDCEEEWNGKKKKREFLLLILSILANFTDAFCLLGVVYCLCYFFSFFFPPHVLASTNFGWKYFVCVCTVNSRIFLQIYYGGEAPFFFFSFPKG